MSKPRKSVGEWLDGVFGTSHKVVSESLTAEQYNQLVIDAGKFRASEEAKQEDDDADETEEESTEDETKDPDPKSDTSIEGRLKALENSLTTSQKALKAEQKTTKTLNSKVTELEGKLKVSEDQKTKLRQSVNPLGDEDVTNSEGEGKYLTQADIDARAAFAKRQSED